MWNKIWKMVVYGPKNQEGLDTHDVRATILIICLAYIIFKLVDALLEYMYMGIFDIIKQIF